MLWLHPVIELIAILVGGYALLLGSKRFAMLHCGVKCTFAWKPHVKWGTIALALWALGGLGGLAITNHYWGDVLLSGTHGWVGIVIIGMCGIGYATGHVLDTVKKKRKVLPLVHGINNCVLLLLALWQAWTGYALLP